MQTPITTSRNLLADPAVVTIAVGVLIGIISGFWRSFMLGWLFGLLVGVIYAVKQTRDTPEHLKRSRFVQFVGSGRFGSPLIHDRRIFDTFLLGFVGMFAELLGKGVYALFAYAL
jgi:hypothetical protein